MDEEVKGRVSSLLSEASRLLMSSNSSNTAMNPSTAAITNSAVNSAAAVNSSATTQRTLHETLRRAQGMLSASTSSGLCLRLNRQERLRAASGSSYQRDKPAKINSKKEKKAMEFALLRCWETDLTDDLEEVHHLKWDSIIANGILMLAEGDDENTIRNALKESLKAKFPLLGVNDFDFVKVRHKKVSTLQLGPGTEYNYAVVKKMAGQGLLYIKVKQEYEYVYSTEDESDDVLLKSVYDEFPGTTNASESDASAGIREAVKPQIQISDVYQTSQDGRDDLSEVSNRDTAAVSGQMEAEIQISYMPDMQQAEDQHFPEATTSGRASSVPVPTAKQLVSEIHNQGLSDPVEILRFLQEKLIQGRDLDVTSQSEIQEGETNYICIDRLDILKTTFAELTCIENFNITFEVDFMG